MIRKKLLSTIITLSMISGLYVPTAFAKPLSTNDMENAEVHYVSPDMDAIEEVLKKEGKLSENASQEEIQKALQKYASNSDECEFSNEQSIYNEKVRKMLEEKGISLREKIIDEYAPGDNNWNGPVRKDKILVVLMDFKDFKHNQLEPEETDRWVKDFSEGYYKKMLFNEKSFVGPNNESHMTMREYYEQQSGGSYSVCGDVVGWFEAAHDAKYYGENVKVGNKTINNNKRAKELVKEAIDAVVKYTDIDLSEYDQFDRQTGEAKPDGFIDHLMIVHPGIGEEAGGGKLKEDAIWSHRSKIPTYEVTDKKGRKFKVSDYTMEGEDTPVGVFSHEYGHDLGLPDEYDTKKTTHQNPVAGWSTMAGGSWFGKVKGTKPSGFSPYCKQILNASMPQGRWLKGSEVDLKDIPSTGLDFTLDQASVKGENDDVVRINLPQKEHKMNDVQGTLSYWAGETNNNEAYMTLKNPIKVTTASGITLKMKTDYKIENGWDYLYVQGRIKGNEDWINLKDNEGKSTNAITPKGAKLNRGNGFTGDSNGWIDLSFDLAQLTTGSAIKHKNTTGSAIELRFNYATDPATAEKGAYIDDIKVVGPNNEVLFSDDAEGEEKFELQTFTKSDGIKRTNSYYLVELRSHNAADEGLTETSRDCLFEYNPGVVIWYCDEYYTKNDEIGNKPGCHPGEGVNGVIDADQISVKSYDKKYKKMGDSVKAVEQLHDAAFSIRNTKPINIDNVFIDEDTFMHPIFDDSRDYTNKSLLEAGKIIPKHGLKVYITSEAKDRTKATIHVAR